MPNVLEPMVFSQPDDKARIWHYMDFTKFISMLENGSLFFSRADCLGDPFEGHYGGMNKLFLDNKKSMRPIVLLSKEEALSRLDEEHRTKAVEEERKTGKFPEITRFYDEEEQAQFDEEREQKWQLVEKLRKQMMISCWCLSDHESAALWKLYSKSDDCVAITTLFGHLRKHLPDHLLVGKVNYVDLNSHFISEADVHYPFMHKRISFEHEHELRIMFRQTPDENDFDTPAPEPGEWINPINLETLIGAVLISPSATAWFKELVEKVVKRYKLDLTVRQSALKQLY